QLWAGAPAAVRSIFVLLLLLLVLPLASSAQEPARPAPAETPFTINVSVDEVVLHATVRNNKGTPVAGLEKENFQVFEDRVLQPIKHFSHADIPVTAGIVIDNSGSMSQKRAEVIAAALAFAASSNPQDQMFLVNFNEHVTFGLPHDTAFTDQPAELKAAMASVKADGKTALYDAVAIALDHLKLGSRDKRVLIVVSDGADNASHQTEQHVLQLAKQSDAIIYSLGIYEPDDPDRSPGVLRDLSKATGGEAYFPESLKDVRPACERIAREIRNQYTLIYTPTNQKHDGSYRSIQVRASTPAGRGLHVTTRPGYTAPVIPGAKTEARN
ncbi:MAG: VWA domain-containing protein, partial [Terriglobales bacterium]